MKNAKDDQAVEKLEYAKDQVIGAISETMDLYGVTPSAGTLYATMYFADQMNLDEMREELGMSKPSMSTSVRKLQENGMVKKTYQRGSRKHTYMAEKDFFRSFMSFYCQMWEREVKMNLEAIHEAEIYLSEISKDETVSTEIRAEAKDHYDMIESSKIYYKWLDRLAQSIQNGKIFEFLPKDPFDEQ
ncbi:DNA-binding transcriptional regulator GbsR (MarR family) [Virgibacillus halotolerans]|uniref:choline uptake/conversion transcriptional regulator CudC n=1 Tax=Virgibacillus halotolerans TaxID=1071053 RepID=UPI001960C5DF|nr:GbsR/MarR family transcriptional regulator [Virgibacillus halotolerans]MBM7599287.1 DNA-binding transcriptional regulator GbsR (MarR family) [Virgibacillus halotolerans]